MKAHAAHQPPRKERQRLKRSADGRRSVSEYQPSWASAWCASYLIALRGT
jgi:hypothetical protein